MLLKVFYLFQVHEKFTGGCQAWKGDEVAWFAKRMVLLVLQ